MKKILMVILALSFAAVITPAWAVTPAWTDAPRQCTKGTCGHEESAAPESTIDPVCGMDANGSKYQEKYKGKTYHFCSARCKKEFDKNPSKFIK